MKRRQKMNKFNLIDEPWIVVMTNEKGETTKVSLRDLFANAHQYKRLAGDSDAQDFAILRVLLAITTTVFSRYDNMGEPYVEFEMNKNMQPIHGDLDEDYIAFLKQTWLALWEDEEFPEVVIQYLETWHDRFYLFSETNPFFQITEKDLEENEISRKKPSEIHGKNINRTISESGNKTALFSPKYEKGQNKNKLKADQIARWLLTYHGYSGLSDKVIFGEEKYTASKGWLFDIGGVYLEGNNLFETLLLNTILVHPDEEYHYNRQKPAWEYESHENLENHLQHRKPDNIAQLYTTWSRAVYIETEIDLDKPFSFRVVKLPKFNHMDFFLEPMTLWRYNQSGEYKEQYTPLKHQENQALWRSFGLIVLPNSDEQRRPGIIDWFREISGELGDLNPTIRSISLQDDGNATSWVPTNELSDELNIQKILITDVIEERLVPRIYDSIEKTKVVVSRTYQRFIQDVLEIRNLKTPGYVNKYIQELYFVIDQPFREWISSITAEEAIEPRILEWNKELQKIVIKQANDLLKHATTRDYTGIETDEGIKNIATSYNTFLYFLNQQLEKGV